MNTHPQILAKLEQKEIENLIKRASELKSSQLKYFIGFLLICVVLLLNLSSTGKQYHMQKGVGHYGVFGGSKFKLHIVPVIKEFAY